MSRRIGQDKRRKTKGIVIGKGLYVYMITDNREREKTLHTKSSRPQKQTKEVTSRSDYGGVTTSYLVMNYVTSVSYL